jgi:uncharacterized protein (TIGR02118 family)
MIKVTVLYPQTPGTRFDHGYYRDRHMPLVQKLLGTALLRYTVDRGLAGGAPGSTAPFVAGCELFFDGVEAFQGAFGPHMNEIMGDIPNYTDREPVVQISEVVVG